MSRPSDEAVAAFRRDPREYLQRRYVEERRSAPQIAAELEVSPSTVVRALRAVGIVARRRGFDFYEARTQPRRRTVDLGVQQPPDGSASWTDYVAARRSPWGRPRVTVIASDLGITVWEATRLIAEVEGRAQPYYLRRVGETSSAPPMSTRQPAQDDDAPPASS